MKAKILIFGDCETGKTSMRRVVFEKTSPREPGDYYPTIRTEKLSIRFLGNLVINIWDCGGQDDYFHELITVDRLETFGAAKVLVYVFDITTMYFQKSITAYRETVSAMLQSCGRDQNGGCQIFCLVHKMDLIPANLRLATFSKFEASLRASTPGSVQIHCFATTLFDSSIYEAWSSILRHVILPNVVAKMGRAARKICNVLEAAEVAIFQSETFLLLANDCQDDEAERCGGKLNNISRILQQFGLSSRRADVEMQAMELHLNGQVIFLERLSTETVILVRTPETDGSAALLFNIQRARGSFQRFIDQQSARNLL